MEVETVGRAKRICPESDSGNSCSTSNSGLGAAAGGAVKRVKGDVALDATHQQQQQQHFFSPLGPGYSQHQHFPSGPLQPADSSTTHTWQQVAWPEPMQPRPAALQRTSSAPELLKLAQADSAAWQNQHAATSSTQQAAFLSHQDHWLT